MCISQPGLEGYWGYHSQADTFGRRLPAFNMGLTRQPREILGLTIPKLRNYEPRILPFNRALYDEDIPTITPSPIDTEELPVAAKNKSNDEIRIGQIGRAHV